MKKKFTFDSNLSEYNFKLKKKANLWWLLLFLLLLVLFIPLKKDITVVTQYDGVPEPYVDVRMDYTARYLLWNKQFLAKVPYDTVQQTDSTGTTVFKDVGYSVFSLLFYFRTPVLFSTQGDCFEDTEVACRFHTTRKVVMEIQPQLTDVRLKVIDAELGFEIPDANLKCTYSGQNVPPAVKDKTDVDGCVVIKDVRVCDGLETIKVSAEGYADTLLVQLPTSELLQEPGGYLIPLRPLKDRFTFFVKNKYTKEPIPGAEAQVSLTERGIDVSGGTTRTNVDGLGQGFYEDARVLAKVSITANKQPHYRPGKLEGDYTVKQFKALPDSLRVVWLEPEPYAVDFRNLDTLSGQPVAGVRNEILIEGIDGTTVTKVEVSNRNGCFPVAANEGDKITIISTLDPYYHSKTTVIPKFEKGMDIYMHPVLVSLVFRTVEIDEDGRMSGVLPDCALVITVDGKKVNPTNSGTGSFMVSQLRLTSKISIEASKADHLPNNKKIKNKSVELLFKSSQDDRDIPLEKLVTLTFRTIDQADGSLLSGCTFVPRGSISGSLKYKEQSPGVFEVTFRRDELVSITASKPGYGSNSTKVKNAGYNQLKSQSDRDIPLQMDWDYQWGLDKSQLSKNYVETKCYDLYKAPVSFTFSWSLCNGCTNMTVTDENGNTLAFVGYQTGDKRENASLRLTSSTRKVCVTVSNDNGHTFSYHISK